MVARVRAGWSEDVDEAGQLAQILWGVSGQNCMGREKSPEICTVHPACRYSPPTPHVSPKSQGFLKIPLHTPPISHVFYKRFRNDW